MKKVGALEGLATGFFGILVSIVVLVIVIRVWPLLRRARQADGVLSSLKAQFGEDQIADESVWEKEVWPMFRAIFWLAEPAKEFAEQCWKDKHQQLRNAHQADGYFTEAAFDPKHAGLGDAAPGLLTAIGILGTFVGITVGLGQIDFDPEKLALSIRQLVQALGVSFRTSIWGLLFSMFTTLLLAGAEGRLRTARSRLVGWVDAALKRGDGALSVARSQLCTKPVGWFQ